MRTRNIIIMCIAMLTIGTVQMQAQGLGGLLKKGKKALEKGTVRWRHTEKPDTTGGGHTTCRGIRQEHVDELRYGASGV